MDQNKLSTLKDFIAYCKKELNIQVLPKISLIANRDFVLKYRSFGEYNPNTKAIKVFYAGRNLADVCRSLAHELCHHRQNELGFLSSGAGNTGSDIENDANAMAGILMRDYGKLNVDVYEIPSTQALNEKKQVGTLYHFTGYTGMVAIIKNDLVLTSTIQPFVSFTRNKRMISDTISQRVRITVDGDELTNKYRITPYADTRGGYGRRVGFKPGEDILGDESEERISLKKYPNGVDISKYLVMIEVKKLELNTSFNDPDDFEFETEPPSLQAYNELIRLLKDNGLPYKIVDNFK